MKLFILTFVIIRQKS